MVVWSNIAGTIWEGHEPPPDQLVHLEQIFAQKWPNVLGSARRVRGPDGFVALLRVLLDL
jgi:hypothetical protein